MQYQYDGILYKHRPIPLHNGITPCKHCFICSASTFCANFIEMILTLSCLEQCVLHGDIGKAYRVATTHDAFETNVSPNTTGMHI